MQHIVPGARFLNAGLGYVRHFLLTYVRAYVRRMCERACAEVCAEVCAFTFLLMIGVSFFGMFATIAYVLFVF